MHIDAAVHPVARLVSTRYSVPDVRSTAQVLHLDRSREGDFTVGGIKVVGRESGSTSKISLVLVLDCGATHASVTTCCGGGSSSTNGRSRKRTRVDGGAHGSARQA